MKRLHKIMSFLLAIICVISMIPGRTAYAEESDDTVNVQENDLANSWRYSNGELIQPKARALQYTTWPEVEGMVAKGIDVSRHNGEIDWEKVKAAGVDFAIIRCGYGDDETEQDDTRWVENADACTELGIPFGTYIYSYAHTVEQASSEADHVLRLVEGYTLDYPIYLDMEEDSMKELSSEELALIAQTFCDKIEAAGYKAGIYANTDWFTNYLTDPAFEQWDKWCAQYNDSCTYTGSYSMWQCSSEGQIDGISGNTDLNIDFGAGESSENGKVTYTKYKVTDYNVNYRSGPGTTYPIQGKVTMGDVLEVENGYSEIANGHIWVRFLRNGNTYYIASTYLKKVETTPVVTMNFSDVNTSDWFYNYVKYVFENELMNGMSTTKFEPDSTLTRAQFATILYRLEGSPSVNNTVKFTDVKSGEWYTNAVLWAAKAGIVTGYSEKVFGTDDPILREQMVTMMYRYAKYKGYSVTTTANLSKFTDASKVSAYAVDAMKWAVGKGYIKGTDMKGTVLSPTGSMTRAQCAAVITRYMQN